MNMPKKFIDFIITQNCTYCCKYCSQSKKYSDFKANADRKTIQAFYDFLKTIDVDYEITITGGEAILHPDFFEIIENIKKMGFKINLISNFSFSIEKYLKIFQLLGSNLNIFDLSFHLDEIKDFKSTILKLEKFLKNKPVSTKTKLFIPIYKLNDEKEEKIEKIVELAKKYSVTYSFQKIRLLDKFDENILTDKQKKKYFSEFKPTCSFSKICHAGEYSAVIYEDGEVYRCYSSRFLKSNCLGNIKNKKFKLNSNPLPCVMKNCTCPKPKAYFQITNDKNIKKAYLLKVLNMLCLPYYIIKKNEIAFTKLKQIAKNIKQNRYS